MTLQMSPASNFPKVEKEQTLLKQMSEYRDEEIPGSAEKKKEKKTVRSDGWKNELDLFLNL